MKTITICLMAATALVYCADMALRMMHTVAEVLKTIEEERL